MEKQEKKPVARVAPTTTKLRRSKRSSTTRSRGESIEPVETPEAKRKREKEEEEQQQPKKRNRKKKEQEEEGGKTLREQKKEREQAEREAESEEAVSDCGFFFTDRVGFLGL